MGIPLKLMKDKKFTVKRILNDGQYDDTDGFPDAPEFEEIEIEGNLQPLSGKELLQVDEGDRERDNRNLFTQTIELQPNDIVIVKGFEFEVRLSEDWDQQQAAHFFYRIVKKDV